MYIEGHLYTNALVSPPFSKTYIVVFLHSMGIRGSKFSELNHLIGLVGLPQDWWARLGTAGPALGLMGPNRDRWARLGTDRPALGFARAERWWFKGGGVVLFCKNCGELCQSG